MQQPEDFGQPFPKPGAGDVEQSQVGFLTAGDPLAAVHAPHLTVADPQQLLPHCLVSAVQRELKHTRGRSGQHQFTSLRTPAAKRVLREVRLA